MALFPGADQTWQLEVMQNTISKTHSTDPEQLMRVVDGILMDGFNLEDTIIIVYIIEDGEKSGAIGSNLNGRSLKSKINVRKAFNLEVIHSVYSRLGAVPE